MSSSPELRLSVAIVTRNRAASLERCLQSWRAQATAPFEIIVSDDSDDAQAPAMQALAQRFDCRYQRGPRRGLYANRNHAALACRGTHLLTGDDDHTHPRDYVQTFNELIAQDPRRIWIVCERHPSRPDEPLNCPPELHPSGFGCSPRDPKNCAAIADGSTVYPRAVFDSGLRYDEAYPFGALWYLWGRELARNGWRITFSTRTWVWHHAEVEGRFNQLDALRLQLETATYASLVNGLYYQRRCLPLSLLYLAKRVLLPHGATWFTIRARLTLRQGLRCVGRALTYGRRRRVAVSPVNSPP